MINCPNCGFGNEDFAEMCEACGTALNVSTPKDKKKKNKNTGSRSSGIITLRTLAAAIGVIACLGVGGVLVARGLSADAALRKAVDKSTASFAGSVVSEESIVSGAEAFARRLENGEYALSLLCESDDFAISTNVDYSRKKKIMSGSADFSIEGFSFTGNYSIDGDLLMVSRPVGMESVYSIDLSDLEKNLKKSPLGMILPDELLELLKVDFFKKIELKDAAKADENRELQSLIRSTKIKYLDERAIDGVNGSIPCKMYQVTWDEEKVKDIVDSVNKKAAITDIGAFLASVMLKLEPDIRCYVNDNKVLVGIDAVFAGARYVFLLEGEENPWDQFSLTITTLTGEKMVYTGGITNDSNGAKCYLGDVNTPYLVLNLTKEGDFVLETAGKGTILQGNLSSSGDTANVEITLNLEEVGKTRFACRISSLKKTPESLSENPIDLSNMKAGEVQRLLLELGILG